QAQAREYGWNCTHQRHLEEDGGAVRTQHAREHKPVGIHTAGPCNGAVEHDEEGQGKTQRNLGSDAQPEPQDKQWRQRDTRQRVQGREHRLKEALDWRIHNEQQPTGDACTTAQHEGEEGGPQGPSCLDEQRMVGRDCIEQEGEDFGRCADEQRIDPAHLGCQLPQSEEHAQRQHLHARDVSGLAALGTFLGVCDLRGAVGPHGYRYGHGFARHAASSIACSSQPQSSVYRRWNSGSFCSDLAERGRGSGTSISVRMRPGRGDMTMTRSANVMGSIRSWVIKTTVRCSWLCSSSSTLRNCTLVCTSSAPKG